MAVQPCMGWIPIKKKKSGKIWHVLAEKKVTLSWLINSNMVKPEKFGHLHLVYDFTVPLGPCLSHLHILVSIFGSASWFFQQFFLMFFSAVYVFAIWLQVIFANLVCTYEICGTVFTQFILIFALPYFSNFLLCSLKILQANLSSIFANPSEKVLLQLLLLGI